MIGLKLQWSINAQGYLFQTEKSVVIDAYSIWTASQQELVEQYINVQIFWDIHIFFLLNIVPSKSAKTEKS